ncbi:MAG: hypothetical protein IPP71_04380 [Bacteroidetes bacterium]|nr:hypothetical protein [Bacteroidota bacterium]
MIAKENIENIVNQWIKSSECFLVEVKSAPSKVTVFIDKPAGVTLAECSSLNRFIFDALEADNVWETHELEVSSPGMDQPLRVYQQYLRRIGREVRIITTEGRELKGKLKSANEIGIELLELISRKENKKKVISEELRLLNYENIKETKLILSFKN